jgi:prefoldin subunit 5
VAVELNKDVAVIKSQVMGIVKLIRTTLAGLWAGTSSTPIIEEAKEFALALKAKVKLIQKEIEPIIDEIRAYQEYIKYLQQLVAYIQSLPAQLQELLAKCLAEATVELKAAQEVVSTLTDQTAVLNELKTEVQSAINIQEVVASGNTASVIPQLS